MRIVFDGHIDTLSSHGWTHCATETYNRDLQQSKVQGGLCHMLKLHGWLSLPTMWVILFMHPLASVPLERSQRWNTWTASTLVTIADTQGRI